MNSFIRNLSNIMVSKTKGESYRREKVADYFLDLSKLSFGAMVLWVFPPMFTGEIGVGNVYQLVFGAVIICSMSTLTDY